MSFFYYMFDRFNSNFMGILSVEMKIVDKIWFMVFRKVGD